MNNITNIFAYTAGYMDGDGCFYIGKYKQKHCVVYEYSIQSVSVKKPVLDLFKETFGGSIRRRPFKIKHRDAFCWTIKNKDAVRLSLNIFHFLIDKREQCAMFISFTQLISHNKFRTVDKDLIQRRDELINNIRADRHMNNLINKEAIEELKNKQHTITPSEIDYPYLAGLIDSEGCFRIKKWKPKNRPNTVYNISLEIGNTKFPILPWLIERFGGSICYIPAKTNKKASAIWTLSAAALYEILPKIRPFLTTKQEICDKLIEFQKTILPNGGDRHSELFRALFEKRRKIREIIIEEVHKFNLKGSH